MYRGGGVRCVCVCVCMREGVCVCVGVLGCMWGDVGCVWGGCAGVSSGWIILAAAPWVAAVLTDSSRLISLISFLTSINYYKLQTTSVCLAGLC